MPFIWSEKLSILNELANLARPINLKGHGGANRRAVGLMPSPVNQAHRMLAESKTIKHKQLMLAIEGKESSLCMQVVSPFRKSRSSALVFRGRVIGCVHGNKAQSRQLFGREAFEEFYFDFVSKDSIVEKYDLPETLVLAGASLFHGNTFKQSDPTDPVSAYDQALRHLVERKVAGCVVLGRSDNRTVGFVYVFDGAVLAVFSFIDGWLKPCFESGLDMVLSTNGALVMASELSANSVREVNDLSFGLSGIDSQPFVCA